MARAHLSHRSRAIGAAILLVALTSIPAQAASPAPVEHAPRPDRPAWDQAVPDDPGRLIVTFRPGTSRLAQTSAITTAGADSVGDLRATGSVTVSAGAGKASKAIASLEADPNVLAVSVDHHRFRDADPTHETYWRELWGLDNTGQDVGGEPGSGGSVDVDIDARQAIGLAPGDSSIVVAVIDDGVDFSHPDLASRAWTNPGESGGNKATNGVDDDGNGYIDDVHGWDFCHDDNSVHDFDDDGHGTHVAGTIAASLDGKGVVGVAPGVSIMALKFIGMDPDCGVDSMAIAAIAYARSFGVRIVNASWGGRGRPDQALPLKNAIATSGMLFIAAAGNDGEDNDSSPFPNLPASFDLPNVLSVAAIDNSGDLASFSAFGKTTVDIAAPGVAILSALPADSDFPVGWGWLDGTSMAAPHVSGTAALVASASPALAADPIALKARLMATGKLDPATSGKTVSGRIVDAYRALDIVPPLAAAPTGFAFVIGSTINRTTGTIAVGWPAATDDRTGVAAYGLQTRAWNGSWLTAVGASSARSIHRTLSFGTSYGFRVRARDGAGNWGAFSGPAAVSMTRFQETSSLVSYSGSWSRYRAGSASGGKTRYAAHHGASVTFRFTGRAFAVVAPRGPTRGSARLYVDGTYISTVDLHRSTTAPRVIVAARSWSGSATHTVKLVVVGSAHHPRFDIDAFAILR